MDGSAAEGWAAELDRWLGPFLARLRRKEQRHWAPFYLKGLILPGERKGTVKLMPATIEKCCCSSALRFTRQRWRP